MDIKIRHILFLLVPVLMLSACKYDNYNPPKSRLYGKVVYQGQPIHVRSKAVTFNLFQKGFKEHTPIKVNVAPDGSYSAVVFDGNYQIIFPRGQGPFIQATKFDTLNVKVRGDTKQNIKVKPYYMFRNPKFSINKSGTVAVHFSVNSIFSRGSTTIQYAALYLNTTRFVNDQINVSAQRSKTVVIGGGDNEISIKVPSLTPNQGYIFARAGIKIKNVEDMLYTRVVKLYLP